MKLNVGAGWARLEGYLNLDRKNGDEAFPLSHQGSEIADGSCDEIRASHLLEHFPHGQIQAVINHWAAKLKEGGVLKIAVPDFDIITQRYTDGDASPIERFIMGGQTDEDDFHKALFNASTLVDYFRAANLTDISRWDSDAPDCSALPLSLNMRAVKPVKLDRMPKIMAIQSLPRTHWTANSRCNEQLTPLGIPLTQFEGVFWGQCLERGLEKLIDDGVEAALGIDYDTLYKTQNVQTLIRLFALNPHADAICAMQQARGWDSVLATVDLPDGVVSERVPRALFEADLLKLKTGHFGLTLIRLSALKDVPKPWFLGVPAPDGSWNDGHTDEDVYFWRNWAKAGKTLYAANRVAVGHMEVMIKWPGRDLGGIYQRVADYWKSGTPKEVWK